MNEFIARIDWLLDAIPWLENILRIGLFFFLAGVVHWLNDWLARPLARVTKVTQKKGDVGPERQNTLRELIASGISVLAVVIALIASIGLFVDIASLVWMVGLFSAAFGFGARLLISDVLTGIGFLFEDSFGVGEKVEIVGVEGVIENMNLRTANLRAPTGELYIIPNGEIRVVRNFSRGRFSSTSITLKIAAKDLTDALTLLDDLAGEAVSQLPNLLEPWQVISPSGVLGEQTELTILTKSRFGKAAEMRPRFLNLIQEEFEAAGIAFIN
jgi:small conductance mechanosensitive channel